MYKILLVDDEPAILEREKLSIYNYSDFYQIVGQAYTVKKAIELIDQTEPDVVLTDIRMPDGTGSAIIKYIYETQKGNTVCIVVSGYSDFEYVHDSFVYGAIDYVLKPIDQEKLEHILEKAKQYLDSVEQDHMPQPVHGLYKQICQRIQRNLSGDNSSLQICSEFHISQSQLSRLFKKHCQKSLNEYVTEMRILKACEYLEEANGLFIGEIANIVGFEDQYYFSKVFKKIIGYAPRDYRNMKKSN